MWPFTKKQSGPPVRSPTEIHFFSFKPGQKALLVGKEVTVVAVDTDFWNDDMWLPTIRVAYWNAAGNFKEEELSPRQALAVLSHKSSEVT